jgi:hypothetical protein
MGRTQTWQTILELAGAATGMAGGGGMLGAAANAGSSLGVTAVLSKYSRNAERDADLNGARMLAAAGYNPLEMATFFEKLEAQMATQPKGLEAWFASHPAPGRRVEAVSQDIRFYGPKAYGAEMGQFPAIKRLVASIPSPKMRPAAALQPIQAPPRERLPQGFTDLHTKDFAVAFPAGWQAGQSEAGGSLFIVPEGGAVKTQEGGIELIAGAMIDYYAPSGGSVQLEAATKALLESLHKGDSSMKIEKTEAVSIGGKAGMVTRLTTRTSYPQDPEQVVQLYSVVRAAGLWTLALAFPKSRSAEGEPIVRQILQTVAFAE